MVLEHDLQFSVDPAGRSKDEEMKVFEQQAVWESLLKAILFFYYINCFMARLPSLATPSPITPRQLA